MKLLPIRMADQDWYAGDVYDDNQYDDDQQQQRQQQPADATAPPAAPAHTSTQPYTRGAIAPRGRDTSSRPDAVGGGGRNVGRTAPAPSRDVIRGGGQSQSGRERVIQREPYHNGNWPHWDGKETARDYKDVPPRDLPRDGFREEPSGAFRDPPHLRDVGGRPGFRDVPIPRDGLFRDDPRDFHGGRDYRADPQNLRDPLASGYRQAAPGPRGDARDHGAPGPRGEAREYGGYRDQPPSQSQHFRDARDTHHYRDQPPSRDHGYAVRGRGGDMVDAPARSYGHTRDAHDDQHFPRDRRVEPPQSYRQSTPLGYDHRQHPRDGPSHRDSQPSGFRDHRDYSGPRESHPMPPHDHRDNVGYRDAAPRVSDAPARHIRDVPNFKDSQPAGFRDHREFSGHREPQPAPHYKDGSSADRVLIPREREISDVSAVRQVQDQPPVDRNYRNDPPKMQNQPEALNSHRSHNHQSPLVRENLSSNQTDRVVPSATPPVEQPNRKIDDRPLPSSAPRDDVVSQTAAPTSTVGHIDKSEKPRFNADGRIYLGRVDWNASRSDLCKLCEKYVDAFFCVLFPFDLIFKIRRGHRRVYSVR